MSQETTELFRLKKAVSQLYYSANWTSDRLSPEIERLMWEEIKVSAKFPDGMSPKKLENKGEEE